MKRFTATYLPHPDNDATTNSLVRAEIVFTAENYASADSQAYRVADILGAHLDTLYEGTE